MATRNRKKLALSVLGLGAATAAVVFGSWASWTAQTNNPGNTVTGGRLTLSTNIGNGSASTGSPILTNSVTNIRPGDGNSGTVTITNSGTGPMAVELSQLNFADAISDTHNVLKFTIYDSTVGVADCVYPAATVGACPTLSSATTGADWDASTALPAAPNGLALVGTGGANWGAGEAHTFVVTWKYTDDGTVDDSKNNTTPKSATFDLQWNGLAA
jgi:hypothetical protein